MEEEEEEDELELLRGELQSISACLGAHQEPRPGRRPRWWRVRPRWTLRGQGEEEREGWPAALLQKARKNVRDKKDNIRRLERSVRWMEEIVANEAKVKEEVVDEVVEVEV